MSDEANLKEAPNTATGVLILGAWFGLLTGLIEGAAFILMQRGGVLPFHLAQIGVSPEIIWIAAAVDLVFFTVVAAVIALIRPLRRSSLAVFLFALVTFFIWLTLFGRIRHLAVIVLSLGLASVLSRWTRKDKAAPIRLARTTLVWLFAAAVLALLFTRGSQVVGERLATSRLPAAPSGTPNILVIVLDTVRADHMSTYNYSRATTPNLDAFAREGVLFEHAFAPSSWTAPSHASFLTGLYPHDHGFETGVKPLDRRIPTLPEVLRRYGYRTGGFSANTFWFCRSLGLDRGFIHFEDYFQSVADMVSRTILGREFDLFVLRRLGDEDIPGRRLAADINHNTLRWIDADHGRPFFAFLNYFDAHDPYLPPEPYRSQFSKLKKPGGIINSFVLRDYPKLTPEQLQGEVDAYDGAIAYMDAEIGELLAQLQARGLADNTVVVITSDHGESFGEHELLGHRNALYRDVIEVPLLIRWPGHVPAGARIGTPVSNRDLMATILDLIGHPSTSSPGNSLAALWKPPSPQDWPLPLSELAQMHFELAKRNPAYSGWMKSLISPNWHFIVHQKLGAELYDFRDSGDLKNLAPSSATVVNEFQDRLSRMLEPQRSARRSSGRVMPSANTAAGKH